MFYLYRCKTTGTQGFIHAHRNKLTACTRRALLGVRLIASSALTQADTATYHAPGYKERSRIRRWTNHGGLTCLSKSLRTRVSSEFLPFCRSLAARTKAFSFVRVALGKDVNASAKPCRTGLLSAVCRATICSGAFSRHTPASRFSFSASRFADLSASASFRLASLSSSSGFVGFLPPFLLDEGASGIIQRAPFALNGDPAQRPVLNGRNGWNK